MPKRRPWESTVDWSAMSFTEMQKAKLRDYDRLTVRVSELEGVLRRVADKQPEVLAMIRREGFVFDSIGKEPGNWQHLAFSLYTELCELDVIARSALGEQVVEGVEA